MSEGIMIFGINGCSQRIDRGFIGLINMFMIGFLTRIFFIQAFLQHGVKKSRCRFYRCALHDILPGPHYPGVPLLSVPHKAPH